MATTKFYLDCRSKAKDGKGNVVITLYHNGSTATFGTGTRLYPNEWNGSKAVHIAGSEAINAILTEKKQYIDKQIALLSLEDRFEYMTATELKQAVLNGEARKSKRHLISDLLNEYVSISGLKDGTKKIYRLTLGKVKAYGGDSVCIENVNLKWLKGFDSFLAKTQGANGRSIYLRAFRAVCNYARHLGIIFQYPFDNFQIKQEETRKRSINIDDLRKFYSYPTTERNSMFRDYFFLMFYLIGINSKDLLLAKKKQYNNGRLEYVREKTGKVYSIKVEPEAKALINKHSGKGEYLLDAMDHCQHYNSFTREINEGIQSIGEEGFEIIPDYENLFGIAKRVRRIKPIIPNITTYYARHTWATIAHEIGISFDVISMALGHSFGNKTTLIYIKPDRKKVDAANRKVIDYLTR